MKKNLALLIVLVTSASLQLPAMADDAPWFTHWDSNHDGKWNWRNFEAANHRWYMQHPGVMHMSEAELRRRFYELDRDHDHLLSCDDVHDFHQDWHH